MDTSKDYYAILGVLPSADVETIQAVYRVLSKKYHPDVSRENPASAEAKMRELNEAYDILSNARKRKQYDNARPDTQSAGSTFSEEEDDRGTTSSYADPRLDENWERIVNYYPDLEKHRKNLELLSQDLAFTYKAYMVTERKFESEQNVHIALEESFLRKYFGSHRVIREFGKNLLLSKKKTVALALNKDIAFFGNDIEPAKFIHIFKQKDVYKSAYPSEKNYHKTKNTSTHSPGGKDGSVDPVKSTLIGLSIIFLFIIILGMLIRISAL